jgi:hypothetical protein
MTQEQALRNEIQRMEKTLSRTGDAWLQRVLRDDISALRKKLKELK